jgi:hypothetical protein
MAAATDGAERDLVPRAGVRAGPLSEHSIRCGSVLEVHYCFSKGFVIFVVDRTLIHIERRKLLQAARGLDDAPKKLGSLSGVLAKASIFFHRTD